MLRRVAICLIFGLVLNLGCQSETEKKNSSSSSGTKRIILVTNGDSTFWDAARAGVKDINADLKLADQGLVATLETNDGTIEGQIKQLQSFNLQTDIAAVGISPVNASNLAIAEELRKLKKKGIPIITFDSDVDRAKFRDARDAFVGTDNFRAGELLGRCATMLLEEGKYITFVGQTSAQNSLDRHEGFKKGVGEKFELKDTMSDDFDFAKAKENVRVGLRNHADANLLVGIYSYNCPNICEVVKDSEAKDNLKVIAFDADKQTLNFMEEGVVSAIVVQDPYQMGYAGVKLLKAFLDKDEKALDEMLPNRASEGGDIYDTGLKVVVPNVDSPIKAEDFTDKNSKFMLLKELREWMTKYNLTDT